MWQSTQTSIYLHTIYPIVPRILYTLEHITLFFVSMTNHICFHFKTNMGQQHLNNLGLVRNAESDPITDLLNQKLHSNNIPQVICLHMKV